jgi:hypothetical protein
MFCDGFKKVAFQAPKAASKSRYNVPKRLSKPLAVQVTGKALSKNPFAAGADGQAVGAMYGGNTHAGW